MIDCAYKIDLLRTESRLNEILRKRLDLLHYRTAYEDFSVLDTTQFYSCKTDPAEKLRQFFSENNRPNIMIVPGGYLSLRQWVPSKQRGLFSYTPCFEEISVDVDVTWYAGYDTGLRVPYMRDYFQDAHSKKREERRKISSMVEHHVSNYFREHYPQFWLAPTNYQQERKPAIDDFGLEVPATADSKIKILLDVKSLTNADCDDDEDDRERTGVIRKLHDNVVYLFADWNRDKKKSLCMGWIQGNI